MENINTTGMINGKKSKGRQFKDAVAKRKHSINKEVQRNDRQHHMAGHWKKNIAADLVVLKQQQKFNTFKRCSNHLMPPVKSLISLEGGGPCVCSSVY